MRKEGACARAAAKGVASPDAAAVMEVFEKTDALLSSPLQQLQRHCLRRAFFLLKTAQDLSRRQKRLATVSAEAAASRRKELRVQKKMKTNGPHADGLRGNCKLQEVSELTRGDNLLAVLQEVLYRRICDKHAVSCGALFTGFLLPSAARSLSATCYNGERILAYGGGCSGGGGDREVECDVSFEAEDDRDGYAVRPAYARRRRRRI